MRPRPADDDADLRELTRAVREEIDRLPERLRQAVLLCDGEGLTREVAALYLGRPVGTVDARLSRARRSLRGGLARRGFALTAAALDLLLPRATPARQLPRYLVDRTVRAASAALGRQGRRAAVAQTTRRVHRSRRRDGAWRTGLPLLTLAAAAGTLATISLYLASPGREGFLTWMLGAMRRACH
jgi:hypothetical protein